MKPKSKKQIAKDRRWLFIKFRRMAYLEEVYGYVPCEYCRRNVQSHIIMRIDGHHIDRDRSNNTPENCAIVIGECHDKVTLENIEVARL